MTAHPLAAPLAVADRRSPHLASVLRAIEATLLNQRDTLILLGADVAAHTPPANCPTLPSEDAWRIVALAMAEVSARQTLIDRTARVMAQGAADIAMDAFAAAAHRLTTNLDVALGCGEEIIELGGSEVSMNAARGAVRATRLAYHHANELGALATLNRRRIGEQTDVNAADLLFAIKIGLEPLAAETSVNLSLAPMNSNLHLLCDRQILRQALTYLLVMMLDGPGVTNVHCSVSRSSADTLEFCFRDDGAGRTLEQRAQAGTFATLIEPAAEQDLPDAAGFAAVRRLVRLLNGAVQIEINPESGTQILVRIPISSKRNDA